MPRLAEITGTLSSAVMRRLRMIFDLESSGRVVLYSALVGVVAGVGAILFFYGLEFVQQWAMGDLMGYHSPGAGSEKTTESYALPDDNHGWIVVLVPTIGGLLCGLLVYTFAPEAEGHGTDAMVRSFHRLKGVVRGRVPIVKGLASVLTISSGGSAGREGPIAQIGAGFGSLLATRLKLSAHERRHLMLAGAAGGIGAVFRAPLGGALFVGEVLYSTSAVESSAFVPAVFSSVIAYTVFAAWFGQGVMFTATDLQFHGAKELPFYLLFGVVCAVVGYVYVSFFYGTRDFVFRRLKIPNHIKPAIGGLLVGLIALKLPQIMAGGYGWIQLAIEGDPEVLSIWLMFVLALAKIIATSLTISSGGSGGVFAPSLFIGAMLGGAYGRICHAYFPDAVPDPTTYVLVGMGGFFAGVAKVPLTALVMVSEMCGSYDLLVPLMLVSGVCVTILSSKITLYEEQVASPVDSAAHLGDFVVDILDQIPVRDVYDPKRPLTLVPEAMPLSKLLPLVARSHSLYFPVVDDEKRMVGIFSLRDVRTALEGNGAQDLIVASDIATFPVLSVTPGDDLHTALQRFTRKNIDEIPVVDPQDARHVIGTLSRRELIAAYDERLASIRKGE